MSLADASLSAFVKSTMLQLSSVRQPRASDPKLAGLQAEGKELLRKKLIGKHVRSFVASLVFFLLTERPFRFTYLSTMSRPRRETTRLVTVPLSRQ